MFNLGDLFLIFSKQAEMWRDGEAYRKKRSMVGPIKHKTGIYNLDDSDKLQNSKQNDNVSRISHKVDTMKLNDLDDANCNSVEKKSPMTQGDKLIKIKAQRRLTRPVLVGTIM